VGEGANECIFNEFTITFALFSRSKDVSLNDFFGIRIENHALIKSDQ